MIQFEPIKELVISLGGVLSKLTEHGFKPYVAHNQTCPKIFIHEGLGIVVKRSYLQGKTPPANSIPTLEIELPLDESKRAEEYGLTEKRWEKNFEKVLIQPLADISNQSAAHQELRDKGHDYGVTTDFGVRNVGFYNGVAVIFDW